MVQPGQPHLHDRRRVSGGVPYVVAGIQGGDQARGVRHIRFHDLRHACATLLLTGGEELAVISKVLGHSDYGTTLKV